VRQCCWQSLDLAASPRSVKVGRTKRRWLTRFSGPTHQPDHHQCVDLPRVGRESSRTSLIPRDSLQMSTALAIFGLFPQHTQHSPVTKDTGARLSQVFFFFVLRVQYSHSLLSPIPVISPYRVPFYQRLLGINCSEDGGVFCSEAV
jgi:hypothetical protein